MFKRILQTAGFSGLLAALLLTLVQGLWVTPLILKAETFEQAPPAQEHSQEHSHEHAHEHSHDTAAVGHSHGHDEEAWAPADGWQRLLSTTGSNLVVAVGFALMLAGLYTLRTPNSVVQGLFWGLAGFAVFVLAPTLGLPPELPGTAAAELGQRQGWWISTAAATAAGLALIVFGRGTWLKLLGAAWLVAPHLIGAPQPEQHASLAPQALQSQFVVASLVANALFWVALGAASAWLFRRGHAGQY